MRSMDPTPEKEERISQLLYQIAGVEESIRLAKDSSDWDFAKKLEPIKMKHYEKLRRIVYGLPEVPEQANS